MQGRACRAAAAGRGQLSFCTVLRRVLATGGHEQAEEAILRPEEGH